MSVIRDVNIIKCGDLIELTDSEIEICRNMSKNKTCYKYSTKGVYSVEFLLVRASGLHCRVDIPSGFLTDGSSGGPDYGLSWLFHDYLYATHEVVNTWSNRKISCTRQEADALMSAVLRYESSKEKSEGDAGMSLFAKFYRTGFSWLSYWNIGWLFSEAWESSGTRGAEFAEPQ